jgi:hypothetical protein
MDDQDRQNAARIERSRPHWMVMWGCYSRLYWAFPRFPVPKGTIASAGDQDGLLVELDSIEAESHGQPPPRSKSRQPPPDDWHGLGNAAGRPVGRTEGLPYRAGFAVGKAFVRYRRRRRR